MVALSQVRAELDHLCSSPACIEVTHLEPVTHAENMRRARERQLAKRDYLCLYGHPYDSTKWDNRRGKRYRRCLTCARSGSPSLL